MKKFFIILFGILFFVPFNVSAVSEVDYDIVDMYVDARLVGSGDLYVREIIALEGSFNGYIRDIVFENRHLTSFTGSESDFLGSDIYNGRGVSVNKVGTVKYDASLGFGMFDTDIRASSEGIGNNGVSGVYEKTDASNGVSLKMYNETKNDVTAFYIEYVIDSVAVLHNDVAEVYYNFIGNGFDDEIEKLEIKLYMPGFSNGDVRVWAHGPLNGNVSIIQEGNMKFGAYAVIKKLGSNTPIDIRMLYPKDLMTNAKKVSNVEALDKILKVEEERATQANNERAFAKMLVGTAYVSGAIYLIGLLGFTYFAYKKYDKEHKAKFDGEYYREINEEYSVPSVEYLMKKNITNLSFSATIMNLIYKKKISVVKDEKKKKDYIFTKLTEDGVSDEEKKIMNIMFNESGNGESVKMSEIKKYANKTSATGNNEFLNQYNSWLRSVNAEAVKEGFYEKNGRGKFKYGLYAFLGFLIGLFNNLVGAIVFASLILVLSIAFVVYLILIRKRSVRGCEEYAKWKAFKKFLEDFGRFDEKDLPEVILWEKFLVYATVLGVADKVSKAMEVKISEMSNYEGSVVPDFTDYYFYTMFSRDLNRTVSQSYTSAISAVSAARSSSSSGSGFGGGFSGGGGFGGGGGGGRGF